MEDAFDNRSGFFIDYQVRFALLATLVTVGRVVGKRLSACGFGLQDCPNLLAGIPRVPLVEEIFEGRKLVSIQIIRVKSVVDGDISDAKTGEQHLRILADLDVISTETGQIFRDDDANLACVSQTEKLLKAGAVEADARISVVGNDFDVGKSLSTT